MSGGKVLRMKRQLAFLGILATLGAVTLAGGRAQATCCRSTADCPAGFTCLGGACESSIAGCTCDADCGPNLRCRTTGVTACVQVPGGAQECHPHSQCLAPWQGPCATDADCGPGGFTCATNGTLCSATDCQPTTICTDPVLPTTCDADADCPAAWTCEPDTDVSTSCIPEVRHCPAQGCPAPTGAKSCRPPMFALLGGSRFGGVPAPDHSCASAGGDRGAGPDGAPGTGGAQAGAGGGPGPAGSGAPLPGSGCQLAPATPGGAPVLALLASWAISIRRATRRG